MTGDDRMPRVATRQNLADLHLSSFGWALTCCGFDREEASDALQSSYLKILEGKARFDGHSSLRTWVFGVVRRTAAERRRRRVVRDLGLVRWFQRRLSPGPAPAPEAASEQDRLVRRLRTMLGRVSSRQREVLHLVFYEEMTIEEAARTLGISLGTARVHYERGKAALREMLSAHREGGMEIHHEPTRRQRSGNSRLLPERAPGGREIGR